MRVPRSVVVMSLVASGFALLLWSRPVLAAEAAKSFNPPCIQWDVKPGIHVNRSRAERLYESSCRWVESNFLAESLPTKPCVTIKVGEACPYYQDNNCVDTVKKVIYLKTWDDRATVLLAESFLLLSIYDKFANGGASIARKIASDELKRFVDVSELRKK